MLVQKTVLKNTVLCYLPVLQAGYFGAKSCAKKHRFSCAKKHRFKLLLCFTGVLLRSKNRNQIL